MVESVADAPGSKLKGPKLIARGGDVLFARLGPSMGNRKSLLVDSKLERIYCSNEFLVLRSKEGVPPNFVLFVVKSDSFVAQGQAKARGATPSRLRLYADDLAKIMIPSHSPEEMRQKGQTYLIGRKKAASLIAEADSILKDVSPEF